jgi:hypothetical protein
MAYRRIDILPHLRNFRRIYGNLDVPRNFVVPLENQWPSTFYGVKLGNKLSRVKSLVKKGDAYVEEDVKQLYSLGLVLDSYRAKSVSYLSALKIYHEKHPDHKCVHRDYVIELDDLLWPAEMRGLKLGVIFNKIKYEKHHRIIHNDLLALQFDLTCDKVIKTVDLAVFKEYFKNEGDLLIQLDFIVPTDDKKWSKKYHGFKLGQLVKSIRADVQREIGAFDKDDIQKLVELGFPLSHHEANGKGIGVLAIQRKSWSFECCSRFQD